MAETIELKIIKMRKDQMCPNCGKKIEAGTEAYREFWTEGGTKIYRDYFHTGCYKTP